MQTYRNFILFMLVFIVSINVLQATNYYLCDCDTLADADCVPGDDANSGTSIDAPWRTTAKINSVITSLQGGDHILFAKGGAWKDASMDRLYNFNSSATNPIVFDSYNPTWGGTKYPILTESRSGNNLFSFVDGGDADHDEGYVVRNLDLRGEGTGQWAIFAYNDADYITLENLVISEFNIGIHCAGANPPNAGADGQNQHMKVINCSITNCDIQGFLGGGDNLVIEECYFENNGFEKAIFNHNVYVSNGDNIIIRNNELYRSAVINGLADGVSLVVHGLHDNLLIEGNYIHEDVGMVTGNAWGIAVDPGGYGSTEGAKGVVIRGNRIENMYNVGIALTSCPGAVVENNIITNESAAGLRAIVAPNRIRNDYDLLMSNVVIRNNTIYLRNADVFTKGIELGGEGDHHVVVSNLISMDEGIGFDMNLTDSAYLSVDYNMMELENVAQWSQGQDLASWTSSRGFDAHSILGDPKFTSPGYPNIDLRPLPSSPTVDAGHPSLSSNEDYYITMRYGIADIGAIESLFTSSANGVTSNSPTLIHTYPNPMFDQVSVTFDKSLLGSTFKVYNSVGQSIEKNTITDQNLVLDFNDLPNGLYLIVVGEYREQRLKIIKK